MAFESLEFQIIRMFIVWRELFSYYESQSLLIQINILLQISVLIVQDHYSFIPGSRASFLYYLIILPYAPALSKIALTKNVFAI